MNIKILEETKNRLYFELEGQGHSFCNMLRGELLNDEQVKIATYSIEHPLISHPKFIIETQGKEPRKALADAANRVASMADKLKKEFASLK
ncbi:DNA-directed RNA polymerase subunit L [Candidatus Woesearchaeota archaeon]|nr:DNA-directed RNA polymerase subunit L [Candidatus Woesearchaeota archaeon]